MREVKVLIVDDSPFQITLLREVLENEGFNVVGEAKSLEEVISEVERVRPDIVTMDITIPNTNGFECTKAIHKIDNTIKVIVVSSMMDDELIKKAKKTNISGYIQKPVDAEELSLLIKRVISDEDLYLELKDLYSKVFREAILDVFNKLTREIPEVIEPKKESCEIQSEGISIVLGITGKYSGRAILDISFASAEKLAGKLLNKEIKNEEELLTVMSEVANMFVGNACSMINKKNKIFGLRVAPPTTLHGDKMNISKAELDDYYDASVKSNFGDLKINVGFKRGESEWLSTM